MIDLNLAGTALLLGLSGAGHCLGMCGGIAGALQMGGATGRGITLAYHGGRIASYALLGALMGQLAALGSANAWTLGLRYLAAFLLIGMGLYIADWWRGMALLERAGGALFSPVQRLSARLLPLRRPHQGFALGLCWGLMPCGLIYSSVAWSATAGSALSGAVLMLIFGLGTLPAMLAVSLGAGKLQDFLRRRQLKLILGILLILSGLWTLYAVSQHGAHAPHNPDTEHHNMQHGQDHH